MVIKRKFDYTDLTITAQIVDNSTQYLWLAFSQNDDGNCILKKVSAFDPSQIFYSIEIAVTEITNMVLVSTLLYLSYDDSSLIGAKYNAANPLLAHADFTKPAGITEEAIDLSVDGSNVFFLLPGNTSGNNSQVSKFNTSAVFDQTIDLLKSGNIVLNSSSITVDSSNNLWVGTNTAPANLVRVYDTGGNVWDFTITELS